MALRDQPYIPLYVQDYLTDEKLNLCAASTQGIYIKLMCILHKSDEYGTLLLKQKDKQNKSKEHNFALKFAKLLPFSFEELEKAIIELVDEGVLTIDKDKLFQKRMVKDCELSTIRSRAGSKGGQAKDKANPNTNHQAKPQASSESDNENVIEDYGFKNEKKITPYFSDPQLNNAFGRWLRMCGEKGKVHGVTSVEALIMKLNSRPTKQNFDEVIQSIENGWVNLHAVRPPESKKGKQPEPDEPPKRDW